MPSISVIIPVFNGESYLAEAVSSIRRQQVAVQEIIVVDDGSTDATAHLAMSLGPDIRYIYQSNRGPAAARNQGLSQARGDLITFLDADDLWTDDKLHRQLQVLNSDPEAEAVLGYCRYLYTPIANATNGWKTDEAPILALKVDCALFRRQVFEVIGLFDESMRISDDVDWFIRARELGIRLRIHDDVVHSYRRHEANLTRNTHEVNKSLLHALRISLSRRRQVQQVALPLPELTLPHPDRVDIR